MKPATIKAIGITASYSGMLAAVEWFDWRATGIFISFIAEVAIMIVVFSFLNTFILRSKLDMPPGGILYGAIAFIGVQLFLVAGISVGLGETTKDGISNFLSTAFDANAITAIAIFFVIYILRVITGWKQRQGGGIGQEHFFTQTIALFGLTLIGFFSVMVFSITNATAVVGIAVASRIGIEIYLNWWAKK